MSDRSGRVQSVRRWACSQTESKSARDRVDFRVLNGKVACKEPGGFPSFLTLMRRLGSNIQWKKGLRTRSGRQKRKGAHEFCTSFVDFRGFKEEAQTKTFLSLPPTRQSSDSWPLCYRGWVSLYSTCGFYRLRPVSFAKQKIWSRPVV